MAELQIILEFLERHLFSFILFLFALLIASEKLFGTLSHLQEYMGFETKWSLEKKHQKEIIEQHALMLDKLTDILNNQTQDIQVIKDMMREQAQLLCDQNASMDRLFEHTAELANKIDEAMLSDEALREGLAALLRDRIKQAHKHYVEGVHEISPTALENIREMFKVYNEKLHENGIGEKMYKEIEALPLKIDNNNLF